LLKGSSLEGTNTETLNSKMETEAFINPSETRPRLRHLTQTPKPFIPIPILCLQLTPFIPIPILCRQLLSVC